MSQKAAAKRRSQARNNFRHICKAQRPKYKRRDSQAAAIRLSNLIRREHERKTRKGSKK